MAWLILESTRNNTRHRAGCGWWMNFCHNMRASSMRDGISPCEIKSEMMVHLLKSPNEFVDMTTDDTRSSKLSLPRCSFKLSGHLSLRFCGGTIGLSSGKWASAKSDCVMGSPGTGGGGSWAGAVVWFAVAAIGCDDCCPLLADSLTCQALKVMPATHVSCLRQKNLENLKLWLLRHGIASGCMT